MEDKIEVVLIYMENCPPCNYLKPILKEVVEKRGYSYEEFKNDTKDALPYKTEYNIDSYPTTLIFKNGRIAIMVKGTSHNQNVKEDTDVLNKMLNTALQTDFENGELKKEEG